MAAKGKAAKGAAKAGKAYAGARSNPYLQRVVEDAELRDNIRSAYESARKAYGRLSNGKGPAKALVEDKKLKKDLNKAADALKDAGAALKEGPKPKKKKGGLGKKLVFLAVGAAIALAVSEDLRTKVLDLLFGKEEEFEYTSTTTPPAPPTPPAA